MSLITLHDAALYFGCEPGQLDYHLKKNNIKPFSTLMFMRKSPVSPANLLRGVKAHLYKFKQIEELRAKYEKADKKQKSA